MTVPATYLGVALGLLEARGVRTADVLTSLGLDAEALEDPAARVDVTDVARLIGRYVARSDDVMLPFELGRATKPTAHGTLGYALLTSASLRDALYLGERFVRLRFGIMSLRSYVEGDTAIFEVDEVVRLGAQRSFIVPWVAGTILRLGEFLLGDTLDVREVDVELTMAEPRQAAEFRKHLPRTTFGASVNRIRLPARWLEHRLPLSDKAAARSALLELERELALFGGEADVISRVRALLSDPVFGYGDLQAAATKLHVSSRTLRRHLQKQGTSYQELLADARKARAIARLRDPAATIEQVAEELGYSDQANFSRAFQKWTGTTPGAFRKPT